MAVSSLYENNLLLNAWQRVMQEQIWTFNQVQGLGAPLPEGQSVYIRDDRDEIAGALNNAINMFANQITYWPRPKWFVDLLPIGRGRPLRDGYYSLQWRKIIEFGQRATTLIEAGVAVVYSDSTGLGVNDTATITVNTTVDASEVQFFFRTADGAPAAGDPRYQIEPLTLTDNGGSITAVGHRALFVKPSTIWNIPYETVNLRERNAADTQDAADFITLVDVYRVYNDATNPIDLLSADGTVLEQFDGEIIDPTLSIFRLGGDCSAACWTKRPNRMRVRYRAGEALVYDDMSGELREAIIRLSNTLMPRNTSAEKQYTHDRWFWDRQPMLAGIGNRNISVLSPSDVKNSFGLLQGAVYAWRVATRDDIAIPRGGKFTRSLWR